RVDDVGADRGRRRGAEDQDQQRGHQGSTAHARHSDEHAYAQPKEDDCRVHDFPLPRSARVLLDFLDSVGRECGVRKDNSVSVVARDLSHTYGELRSLDRIDLAVGDDEVVALVGPSGCGKSTLLEIVCGLREPSAGEIAVEGDTSAARRLSHCAYMPQKDLLLPWFSALDNAALALRNRGVGKGEARAT